MCKSRRMLFLRVVYDCNNTQSVSSEYPSALSISKMSAEDNGFTQEHEGYEVNLSKAPRHSFHFGCGQKIGLFQKMWDLETRSRGYKLQCPGNDTCCTEILKRPANLQT